MLYSFIGGTDGANPYAGLVRDSSGNLYGTTKFGGANNSGTVFKITAAGTESVLYAFSGGTDGAHPFSSLVLDASGNLYGTTIDGGAHSYGTVYKITTTGAESVMYSFSGGTDGANPQAGLVRDTNGNFYGTTVGGGAHSDGTVFKITATGAESVLYAFTGGADGANPYAGLVMDGSGNLYGTTANGSTSSSGSVFKITAAGSVSVLHSFFAGDNPYAGLVLDASGNLYGTTFSGGANGWGSVFKITTTGTESVLYSFIGTVGSSDGYHPYARLVLDGNGNLYGTTVNGGAYSSGTIFKITPAGAESVLYSFIGGLSNSTDGTKPYARLLLDASGNLYGTTSSGGPNSAGGVGGAGTVFRYVP